MNLALTCIVAFLTVYHPFRLTHNKKFRIFQYLYLLPNHSLIMPVNHD